MYTELAEQDEEQNMVRRLPSFLQSQHGQKDEESEHLHADTVDDQALVEDDKDPRIHS